MAKHLNARASNTNPTPVRFQLSLFPTAAIAFAAAITGTVVGFVATLSIAMPMVHQALAAEVSGVNARLASSVSPDEQACLETGQSGGAGAVLGVETSATGPGAAAPTQPPAGGQGSGPSNVTKNIFIKKLIGGQLVTNTAAIENTGPGSSNEVITKNTSVTNVTNTNDVHVSTTNNQSASSGSANVSDNTNGGSAASGTAANTNDTSLALTINN